MSTIRCNNNCIHQSDGYCFLDKTEKLVDMKLSGQDCPHHKDSRKSKKKGR